MLYRLLYIRGNLLKVVPWVSVWHPNMNFSTPFSILKSLWTLINIFPQYLKIIMCKLPDFFGGRSQDVHFQGMSHTNFFFNMLFSWPKTARDWNSLHILLFSCNMMPIRIILYTLFVVSYGYCHTLTWSHTNLHKSTLVRQCCLAALQKWKITNPHL